MRSAIEWATKHPNTTITEMVATLPKPYPEGIDKLLTIILNSDNAKIIIHDNRLGVIESTWYCGDESGGDWEESGTWGADGGVYPTGEDEERITKSYRQHMIDCVNDWSGGTYWSTYRGERRIHWWDIEYRKWDMGWSGEIGIGIGAKVQCDPPEPECSKDGDHYWISPYDLVGGIEENPGVYGHGGDVVITEACAFCSARRHTDTWAQDPSTGEQGLKAVWYDEHDEGSEYGKLWREWVYQGSWCVDIDPSTLELEQLGEIEVETQKDGTTIAHLPGLVVNDGHNTVHVPWADEGDDIEALAQGTENAKYSLWEGARDYTRYPAWLEWDRREEAWNWVLGNALPVLIRSS